MEGASVVVDVSNSPSFEDARCWSSSTLRRATSWRRKGTPEWGITSRCRSLAPTACPTAATSGRSSLRRLITVLPIPYSISARPQFFEFIARASPRTPPTATGPAATRAHPAHRRRRRRRALGRSPGPAGERHRRDRRARPVPARRAHPRAPRRHRRSPRGITDPRRPTSVSRRASGPPARRRRAHRRRPLRGLARGQPRRARSGRAPATPEARRAAPRSEPSRRGTADVPSSPGPRPARPARRATAPAAGARRSPGRGPPR